MTRRMAALLVVAMGFAIGGEAEAGEFPFVIEKRIPMTYFWGPWGTHVTIADMDGDGDPDIVSKYDTIQWAKNNGAEAFVLSKTDSTLKDIEGYDLGDVDGDGDLDLVVVSEKLGVIVSENLKKGRAWKRHVVSATIPKHRTPGHIDDVRFADLDGDGDLDIVGTGAGLSSFMNEDGKSKWSKQDVFHQHAFLYGTFHVADVNGDGKEDLIGGNPKNQLVALINKGDHFKETILDGSGKKPTKIVPVDFDFDGDIDVLSTTGWQMSLYENVDGEGTWGELVIGPYHNVWGYSAITPIDYDNDGDMDVMTSTGVQAEMVLYENDDEEFTKRTIQERAGSPVSGNRLSRLFAADFDGDGDDDLFTFYENSGGAWTANKTKTRKEKKATAGRKLTVHR